MLVFFLTLGLEAQQPKAHSIEVHVWQHPRRGQHWLVREEGEGSQWAGEDARHEK